MPSTILRLGTRGSLLAQAQSNQVADELMRLHPDLQVEIVIVKTTGDRITDRPLHSIGGKGLFTKELEQALLANEIDFAVHSLKDVPVTMPLVPQEKLVLAVIPKREDPRDALVSLGAKRIGNLPHGARVGTSSLRRQSQLLAQRPDLQIQPLRGNLDTRLRKLRDGEFTAIILAMAGLNRAGLFDEAQMAPVGPDGFLPAAGQGALALQTRLDDSATRDALAVLHDPLTAACVEAERAIVLGLHGDCHSPIAAYATLKGSRLNLRAAVGASGGGLPVLTASANGPATDSASIVARVLADLTLQGAPSLLKGLPATGRNEH